MLGVFSLSPTSTRLATFFFNSSFNTMMSPTAMPYFSVLWLSSSATYYLTVRRKKLECLLVCGHCSDLQGWDVSLSTLVLWHAVRVKTGEHLTERILEAILTWSPEESQAFPLFLALMQDIVPMFLSPFSHWKCLIFRDVITCQHLEVKDCQKILVFGHRQILDKSLYRYNS